MRYIFFVLFLVSFNAVTAQPDSLYFKAKAEKIIRPEWKQSNKLSVDLNQATFVNWNAGGSNTISALFGYEFAYNYSDRYFFWKNNLVANYGVNGQQGREPRKTADLIDFNSNFGFSSDENSHWFYSARFNFKTQFANGYKYPNTDKPISRFMAPGYLFFGGGMEYGRNIDEVSFYLSPITLKATFVMDDALANSGAFGVTPAVFDVDGNVITPGRNSRTEAGILMTNEYEMEIAKNIIAKNLLSLYSDYINNFGNIDVDWRVNFDFKVNSFVRATLESHIKYDDDIKTTVPSTVVEGEFDEAGAKVQWKQFLGIGFAVDF
ncbi:DUF3078 domain-containing protein [Flavobacteriaceae bacterium XHP0103]|uniref:DUF3078 domain-containing protein n=1 Tax=Marixanthotalea marina TaxID=2844359 RepID=UPI00298A0036|nr:DUF3078 domain-containing protein [Marixanthotalea marina]MBU3822463.1 DUF3078 domain-containing protein [Marixanthotalea marina]